MTFGHYTAHTSAFTRSLRAMTDQVASFTTRLAAGLWAHHFGGTPPWPVAPVRGTPPDRWCPDRRRVAADRRRRKETRRLHARLRRSGRNKGGLRT